MKKVILVLLVTMSGYCFGDTGRLEKVVEAFLEKGSYIKVEQYRLAGYIPKHSIVHMEVVLCEHPDGTLFPGIFIYRVQHDEVGARGSFNQVFFEESFDITQDENGNIIATEKSPGGEND